MPYVREFINLKFGGIQDSMQRNEDGGNAAARPKWLAEIKYYRCHRVYGPAQFSVRRTVFP